MESRGGLFKLKKPLCVLWVFLRATYLQIWFTFIIIISNIHILWPFFSVQQLTMLLKKETSRLLLCIQSPFSLKVYLAFFLANVNAERGNMG